MTVQWFDRETLLWVVRNFIQEVDVVLDIGCGIRPLSAGKWITRCFERKEVKD